MLTRLAAALVVSWCCFSAVSAAPYYRGHCRHGHCSSNHRLHLAADVDVPRDMREAVEAVQAHTPRELISLPVLVNYEPPLDGALLHAASVADWRLIPKFDVWSERVHGAFSPPAPDRGRLPRKEGD